MAPLESVPNFSEGRDQETIAALARALAQHCRVLDVHSDRDHNRSVFTLLGEEDELIAALLAGIEVACERIDLRRHEGCHPRIGAADVIPLVPVTPGELERAQRAARRLAERVAALGLPVFLYSPPERGPAFYRRGGIAGLERRLASGELVADFGPRQLHPSAGAVMVGAREPLIAFNINLRAPLPLAREIAAAVRERGGGYRGLRALGLALPTAGLVQVSLNVEDWRAAPLDAVIAEVSARAAAGGGEVVGCELVGLFPAAAAAELAGRGLRLDRFDASSLLELQLLPEELRPPTRLSQRQPFPPQHE